MEKSVFKSTEARLDLHDLRNVVNLREKIEKAKKQTGLKLIEREDGFALVGSATGLLEFEKSCQRKEETDAKGGEKDIYIESDTGDSTYGIEAFLGGFVLGDEKSATVSYTNISFEISKFCHILLTDRDRVLRLLDKGRARMKIKGFSDDKLRVKFEKTSEKSKADEELKKMADLATDAMKELMFPLDECNKRLELVLEIIEISDVKMAILRKDEKTTEWKLYALVKSPNAIRMRTRIESILTRKCNKNDDVAEILKDLCDEPFRRRSSPQDTTENRIASKPGAIARGSSNGALVANMIAEKKEGISWESDEDNEVVEIKSKEVMVGDEDIVDYMCNMGKDRLNEIKGEYAVAIEPRNEITMVIKSKRSDVKGAEAALTTFTQEMHQGLRKETIDISKLDSVNLKMRKMQAKEEANDLGYQVGFERSGELCIVGPSSDMYRCVAKLKSILGLSSGREAAMGNDTYHSQVGVGARPKENGVMRSPLPPIGSSHPGKAFTTSDQRLQVLVWVTDITKLHVDIVVNAANEHLSHGAGVALAIANAAGDELDQECRRYHRNYDLKVSEICLTTAGNMPSKKVMHAVGPRWAEYRDKKRFEDALYKTFLNCLDRAHKNKYESIALPAISSGIFGGPKEVVAEMAVKAVVHFAKQYPSSSLRFIHFVDILQDTISCIQDKFTRKAIPEFREERSFDDFDRWLGKTSKGNKTHQRTFDASSSGDTATKSGKKEEEDTCSICMDTPTNPKTLPKCKHTFCKACIDECFKRGQPKCPNCGEIYGAIQGTQPKNGKMTITKNRESLPGYRDCGTIQIDYYIPGGIQEECHPNPGQRYEGTQRQAFLPNNREGNEILQLLRRAFDARMIFTIGRSVTSGQDNCVVWNCIHHKTRPSGGAFGYPDPTYLDRVRDELAAQGFK